jgi:hypothetical protein
LNGRVAETAVLDVHLEMTGTEQNFFSNLHNSVIDVVELFELVDDDPVAVICDLKGFAAMLEGLDAILVRVHNL